MRDLSDLRQWRPSDPDTAAARARLERAFTAGRKPVNGLRAVAAGLALFLVWSIAPQTANPDTFPLIGLAQAVARLPAPEFRPGSEWYVRAERRQRVLVTGPDSVTLMLTSIEESWFSSADSARRRTTVSMVESLPIEDRLALGSILASPAVGTTHDARVEPLIPASDPVWEEGYQAFYARLEDENAAVGGDQAGLLRLAVRSLHEHAPDPSKRGVILASISLIPGIDVIRTPTAVAVIYEFVVKDLPQRLRYEFDEADGTLLSELVVVLATPSTPEVTISAARYEQRMAIQPNN